MSIIVTNSKWRRWIFEPSDADRAKRFAALFDLEVKEVREIPGFVGYTVWVGSEVKIYQQRELDMDTLFIGST